MKRLLLIINAALLIGMAAITVSSAESEYFIMCQPDSFVNVREAPRSGSHIIGYLELGEKITSDGQKKSGFIHAVDLHTESGEGWISIGYLVDDKPQIETSKAWIESKGRVACRRAIGGDRRSWLKNGDELVLYASSAEWSVTDKGFIKTEFIISEW